MDTVEEEKSRRRSNNHGKLPGGTHITYPGMPEWIMRKTQKAKIPSCRVCRKYGAWDCGAHHV